MKCFYNPIYLGEGESFLHLWKKTTVVQKNVLVGFRPFRGGVALQIFLLYFYRKTSMGNKYCSKGPGPTHPVDTLQMKINITFALKGCK